jgi:chorismate mutase/prephenate dehydratase
MPHVNVAFLGPEGTHSHEAAIRRFGPRFTPRPCRTLREVMEALAGVDAALVPVENSVEGPVTQTLDLLAQRTNVVVQEAFDTPIRNHLAARAPVAGLNGVRVVYSHPQVLGQCEQWLHRHLPHADLVPVASTAEAARRAAGERRAAAVASQVAIELHRLRVLASDIQDMPSNATRFLLVTTPAGPRIPLPKPRVAGRPQTRTLLHLILHDRPGALLAALVPFDRNGMNLTFIQSRPLPGRAWDYGFFVEVDAPGTAPALKRTLKALASETQVCRVISSYASYGLLDEKAGKARR